MPLPFSDTVALDNIVLRDSYADIYVRYTIDDMLFNFVFYPGNQLSAEDIIAIAGRDNADAYRLLATVNDVDIYIYERANDNHPSVGFTLGGNGFFGTVHVFIPCANPNTCDRGWDFGHGHSCDGEWVDRQAAIDGILQFEFRTLF